jgi:hypothetical protein
MCNHTIHAYARMYIRWMYDDEFICLGVCLRVSVFVNVCVCVCVCVFTNTDTRTHALADITHRGSHVPQPSWYIAVWGHIYSSMRTHIW